MDEVVSAIEGDFQAWVEVLNEMIGQKWTKWQ